MCSVRHLFFRISLFICAVSFPIYSAGDDDADKNLLNEIINSGKSTYKDAKKEKEFQDAEVMVALLRQRRFDDLAARLNDAAKAPALPDGNLPLYRFLEKPPFSFDDVIYLDEWCRNSPANTCPFLVRGAYYLQEAWNARGIGFSSTVSDEQRKKFRALMALAGADFKKAIQSDSSNGLACSFLVYWAGCGGSNVREAEYYFKKGVRLLKGDPGLHYYMLWVYTPKWHGDAAAMLDFAKKSSALYPENLGFLVGVAHEETAFKVTGYNGRCRAFFDYFRSPGVWEQVFEAFKPVIKNHPQSIQRRVQLFKYAVYADRIDELWTWLRKEQR